MDKKLFTQRLIELRGERSRHSVAKDLFLKDQTLEKYEKGATLPNIEKAAEIAQYYGVSTDYLLGLTDIQSPDTDIQAICNFTGLSEKAIERIHSRYEFDKEYNGQEFYALNSLLTYGSIFYICNKLWVLSNESYHSINLMIRDKDCYSIDEKCKLIRYELYKEFEGLVDTFDFRMINKPIQEELNRDKLEEWLSKYNKNPRPNDDHSDGE